MAFANVDCFLYLGEPLSPWGWPMLGACPARQLNNGQGSSEEGVCSYYEQMRGLQGHDFH